MNILAQAKEAVSKMTQEQKRAIYTVLRSEMGTDKSNNNEYGPYFSFQTEINEQIEAVRAMRKQVMNGNRMNPDVSIRDAKETLSASTSLLQTLVKSHKDIQNFERLREVENILVEVAKDAGVGEEVLRLVEERLG